MKTGFAAVAVLAAMGASQAQAPPPQFSPWYGEALRDILKLEEPGVAQLERRLASNPEDLPTRLKLMAYEARTDRAARPDDLAKRIGHTLWLIEHHPESELLHSFVTRFSRKELSAAELQRCMLLWDGASRARPHDAAVQWNAASFFENLDRDLYQRYLEATAAADPNHPYAIRPLADLYALTILNGGPSASRAQAALDASKNVWVISNAAYMLQSQYNLTVQRGAPDLRVAQLAERYFLRAKALDPSMDRQKILPQLDLVAVRKVWQSEQQAQQNWQAKAAAAVAKIRRLPPDAFPSLPPAVAGVLRARHCTVPQPSAQGSARNVVRGEFFTKGEAGWAVLCSVNHRTAALLAFRNDRDTNPDTVNNSEDQGFVDLSDLDHPGYLHEITAVGRDFIMQHYRAYGGPQPPPIDHQGIDDSFQEKASVTWYWHNGKWLQLTGAD